MRHCLTVDLVDDAILIAAYEEHHEKVWPEILSSITGSGITQMEIYRFGNRLFMIIDAEAGFTFERKILMDSHNPDVARWETLMWEYQQAIPGARAGEKWVLMKKIFDLHDATGAD